MNIWIMQIAAMLLTVILVPRLKLSGVSGLVLTVLGLSLVNTYIWDASLFFGVPDSLTYRSVVLLLCNGILFWALVKLLPGIEIEGILPAIVAPVVFTICNLLINQYGADVDWSSVLEQVVKEGLILVSQAKEYLGTSQ